MKSFFRNLKVRNQDVSGFESVIWIKNFVRNCEYCTDVEITNSNCFAIREKNHLTYTYTDAILYCLCYRGYSRESGGRR